MVDLIQDPKGESVMGPSTADTATSIHTKPTAANGPLSQDDVSQLKQRILELERKLQDNGIVMIFWKFLLSFWCIIFTIFQVVHCEQ